MRKTLRPHGGSKEYWTNRWVSAPVDLGTFNHERYPGKYSEKLINSKDQIILEAGFGAGRIFLYYYKLGYNIHGIEYIAEAVNKVKAIYPSSNVSCQDIFRLDYKENFFDVVLAFGLYHSLEKNILESLIETRRVMKKDGLLAVSIRINNIQNRIIDYIEMKKFINQKKYKLKFHKWNFAPREFSNLLEQSGFKILSVDYEYNMPFLYKFKFFRHKSQKNFDEKDARAEGYKVSFMANIILKILFHLRPQSMANVMVFIAKAI